MILSLFWENIVLRLSKYDSIFSIIKVLVNISCGLKRFPVEKHPAHPSPQNETKDTKV